MVLKALSTGHMLSRLGKHQAIGFASHSISKSYTRQEISKSDLLHLVLITHSRKRPHSLGMDVCMYLYVGINVCIYVYIYVYVQMAIRVCA